MLRDTIVVVLLCWAKGLDNAEHNVMPGIYFVDFWQRHAVEVHLLHATTTVGRQQGINISLCVRQK